MLAKGSLTSKSSGEGEIRKALVEARLVDCIVNLPGKLFLNTQIPASLWFLSRNWASASTGSAAGARSLPELDFGELSRVVKGNFRNRTDEILFIDARNLGHLINRRTLEFTDEDIATIAQTYHNWRNPASASTSSANGAAPLAELVEAEAEAGNYQDVPGFCMSASLDRVRELDYVLTPGRYVGLPEDEDDFDFEEGFTKLQAELMAQIAEESHLNKLIQENLAKVMLASTGSANDK